MNVGAFVLILVWIVTACVLVQIGREKENKVIMGIGAIMVLMTVMIADF